MYGLNKCLEWFRLFVGDLSNDVSDDVLANAFNKYASFTKARVIRDRLSSKVNCPASCNATPLSSGTIGKVWLCSILQPRRFFACMEGNGWCVSMHLHMYVYGINMAFAGKYVGNRPVKLQK